MDAGERRRAHVWISGQVQRVFFRATTRQVASEYRLAGWVRNLPDGRVEAVFEGSAPAIQRLLAWCSQGPPSAQVNQVEVEWEAPQDEPPGFRVR